jgi:tetratricopeptide (TPR) repeat protein/predicted Ser/Thr protein kinase
MGSSHLHGRASSSAPPAHATIRLNRILMAPMETVCDDTPPPVSLAADYELVRMLGRGGMGIVYLARQRGLKRNVAYKVLTQFGSLDPETLGRFRGEAETLAKLQHSGIVQVYDAGSSSGAPYLVMEYVAGGSLADRVRAGRQDARSAASMIATVAAAVGYAHAHGIIHRDLKPANILLAADGQPKVADFGLARDLASAGVTRTGFIAGTPAYMAPEQLAGHRDLGPGVDVWALGAMLYELLAGTVPFAGDDPAQILANIYHHDPVSLRRWHPHLTRDLETICLKCLHKEPHRRYRTAYELAEDLRRFLDGQPIQARPVAALDKVVRWTRRNPLAAGLLVATSAIFLGATALALALANRAEEQRVIAELHAERANRARLAEQMLREDAERLAAAETAARQQAERSAAAEKKAHEDADRMTGHLENLLTGIRPGPDPLKGFREQLTITSQRLLDDTGDPIARARIFFTLGITRRYIGDYREAIPLMERCYELRLQKLGLDDSLVRKTACELSYSYYHVNRNDEAMRVLIPSIEAERRISGPESDATSDLLAMQRMIYAATGRFEEEAELGDRLLAIKVRKYGPDHEVTEWNRVNLHRYQVSTGNFDASIPVLRKAYARLLTAYGIEHYQTGWTRVTLGLSLLRAGRPREALPYLEPNQRFAVGQLGPYHVHALYATTFLAECYEALDRHDEAIPLRRHLLEQARARGNHDRAAAEEKLLAADLAAAKAP